MDDNVDRVGDERHDHAGREVVEDQLAEGAEVQPLPPQPFLFLLPLLGRPGEGFPTGSCHDRAHGLCRRLGRGDTVGDEDDHEDEEEHPREVEVYDVQDNVGRGCSVLGARCKPLTCHYELWIIRS